MRDSRLWEQVEAAASRQLRDARHWCKQQAPGRRWVALFDLTGAGSEVWWPPLVLASVPPALTVQLSEAGFAAWVADWRQWPNRLEPEDLGVEDSEGLVARVNGRPGHWHETVFFFRGCFARAAVREAGGRAGLYCCMHIGTAELRCARGGRAGDRSVVTGRRDGRQRFDLAHLPAAPIVGGLFPSGRGAQCQ